MTKLEDVKKPVKKAKADHVYEPSETVTEYDPYDTKVGGKPAATLADGTVPMTVKNTASKAE